MTWNEHLRKAQDALARNNISLAEIESALALKDAIAVSNPDESAAAFQTVQSADSHETGQYSHLVGHLA